MDVVIVSGCRTAIGGFGGSLSETPASDLGAHVIKEAVARAGIDRSWSTRSSWAASGRSPRMATSPVTPR